MIVETLAVIAGMAAVVAGHELVHVAVARAHGYPVICVGFSPVAVAVVFADGPRFRYWLMQFTLPLLATWGMLWAWLWTSTQLVGSRGPWPLIAGLDLLLLTAGGLAFATSLGDLASLVMEVRRPVFGEERVRRDLRILRKLPATRVVFTSGGQQWIPTWESIAPDSAVPSTPGWFGRVRSPWK